MDQLVNVLLAIYKAHTTPTTKVPELQTRLKLG